MLKLKVPAQNYEWGQVGADNPHVAVLGAANADATIDAKKTYAELWMGTHPSGPAVAALPEGSAGTLSSWLAERPKVLGEKLLARFEQASAGNLPFLFKVLSIRKALSIQAHPDKKLAEKLHAEKPDVYKDDNHKPEMTIALTKFRALCQFMPRQEIRQMLREIEEFKLIMGLQEYETFYEDAFFEDKVYNEHFKTVFQSVLKVSPAQLKEVLTQLTNRIEKIPEGERTERQALVLELNEQYPGDVGILTAMFLNLVLLEPGAGIVLAANEPHAYLAGECVECMATSDNVIRAGLTPKFKDVPTLIDNLTYNNVKPTILRPEAVGAMRTYNPGPDFDEFEVRDIRVPAGATHDGDPIEGGSIMLIFEGEATCVVGSTEDLELIPDEPEKGMYANTSFEMKKGEVYFVGANVGYSMENTGSGELRVFLATCNSLVYSR